MAESIIKSNGNFDVLWTNSNIDVFFSAQTVSIDYTGYRALLIQFFEYGIDVNRRVIFEQIIPIDQYYSSSAIAVFNDGSTVVSGSVSTRKYRIVSNGVLFEDAYNQGGMINGQCMPYRIYGIK